MTRTARSMITPSEAAQRALDRYERRYCAWGAALLERALLDEGVPRLKGESLVIPLRPPTEHEALADLGAARDWVRSWRDASCADLVRWEERGWSSVGPQNLPLRLVIESPDQIARIADRIASWLDIVRRTSELAARWNSRWKHACPVAADASALARAYRLVVRRCGALDEREWKMLLLVLDWLMDHPHTGAYVRQLSIRGIDTKWMERHEAIVRPLFRAMTGADLRFARQSALFRMRVLDPRLALCGLDEFALSSAQLTRYPHRPDAILICENLVNILALPEMDGVLAIHGAGYAVGELGQVDWLADVPLLYWGDLDSNGFAILNRLRSHLGHAASVMMDDITLDRYRDLCVEERTPNTGELARLTKEESSVLSRLLSGDAVLGWRALRLEQERVEWRWALDRIMDRLERLSGGGAVDGARACESSRCKNQSI